MGDRSSMDLKLSVIETITDNFSDDKKVGSGGYGIVYKAEYNGIKMAVKKLHPLQGLDDKEFHNELLNLTTVSHKNIVRLIGYCHDTRRKYIQHNQDTIWAGSIERVLCFEYMEGGSLETHIADESCELDWPTCYNIIRGTCQGLNHLHNAPKKAIFHLDLKPANILLDQSMTPKIGDLGLSKVFSSSDTHQTEILRGTFGYMPPEYRNHRLISNKFDVFSFGVVILKMLAGNEGYLRCFEMPPEDFIKLVSENWTRRLQAMPRLYSSHEIDILRVSTCAEIALRCVEEHRGKRPHIEEILHELDKLEAEINIMSLTSGLSKGLTLQRSCGSNVVSVDPSWELCFHFELGKKASSCMQISNNTDGFIAFNVKMNPNKYLAVPSRGTMPPCSKHDIVMMMEAQHKEPPNLRCQDMLHVQATGVTQQQASDLDGIDNQELFETFMAEREVNVVKLPIKYVRLSQ